MNGNRKVKTITRKLKNRLDASWNHIESVKERRRRHGVDANNGWTSRLIEVTVSDKWYKPAQLLPSDAR